jgi:TctA family transporter
MLIGRGDFLQFFSRPIAAVLGVLVCAIWILPLLARLYGVYKKSRL